MVPVVRSVPEEAGLCFVSVSFLYSVIATAGIPESRWCVISFHWELITVGYKKGRELSLMLMISHLNENTQT